MIKIDSCCVASPPGQPGGAAARILIKQKHKTDIKHKTKVQTDIKNFIQTDIKNFIQTFDMFIQTDIRNKFTDR